MPSDYSEQDTERARQAERSSAGQPTREFGGPPPAGLARRAGGTNNLAALALIAVGVLMVLGRVVPDRGEFTGGMVLLTIASCFLFFAFWRRIYGLLIPGCILAGLSAGVTFASVTSGVSVLWGLALGFVALLFLGRVLFNVRGNWPIYPAVPLFAVGVIVAVSQLPWLFAGGLVWLPLLLIGAGLYLGWARPTR
ncbi:MAG TPA: hypothetical protein VF909_03295 [Roseiflexaceae bacterium]